MVIWNQLIKIRIKRRCNNQQFKNEKNFYHYFFSWCFFFAPVYAGYDDPWTDGINEGAIGKYDDPWTDGINEGAIGKYDDPWTDGINEGAISW